ncbi:hypothetical protein ACWGJ1_20590 [Bacillus wiedmannii]|nr:hypothetical protein [Bacillus wiedmannii]
MRQPNEGFKKSIENIKKKDSEITNKLNTLEEIVKGINRRFL